MHKLEAKMTKTFSLNTCTVSHSNLQCDGCNKEVPNEYMHTHTDNTYSAYIYPYVHIIYMHTKLHKDNRIIYSK